MLHELSEQERDSRQVPTLARDVGAIEPVEEQALDVRVWRGRVAPDRPLFSAVPPDLEQARCSVRPMVAVLERSDAPGEEEVELARERVRNLEVVVKEGDAGQVRLAGDRVEELKRSMSHCMRHRSYAKTHFDIGESGRERSEHSRREMLEEHSLIPVLNV